MNPAARSKTSPISREFQSPVTEVEALSRHFSHISSKLMGNIAHDLRTPVTAVRGYLKMLLNQRVGPITADQAKCLEGALSGLDQILGIANTVGGGSDFTEKAHLENLDLQEIWSSAANSVHDKRVEKGIELQEDLQATRQRICGDSRMLREVVEKLAGYTIEFAGRDTECLAEMFNRKTGDVVLRISFFGTCSDSDLDHVVSELHSCVFLHGGRLNFNKSAEDRHSFVLSLPGCDA